MNEHELTELLDRRGQLDDARGPGCYALAVDAPDSGDQVARHWHRHHDQAPSEGFYSRLAEAGDVLYVGAASHVYDRLCDHVAGDVRQAAFLEAFPPAELHNIYPATDAEAAYQSEWRTAKGLAHASRRVWTDGVLL